MSRKKREELVKMSMYLPKRLHKALTLVKEEERILISYQIEIALRSYFDKYKTMLASKGVNLWSEKS